MSELIQQIKLFHILNLHPLLNGEIEKWKCEIERNLLIENNIHECYIKIERIEQSNIQKIEKRKIKKNYCRMCKNC